MRSPKPAKHGRDHRSDGEDPIPVGGWSVYSLAPPGGDIAAGTSEYLEFTFVSGSPQLLEVSNPDVPTFDVPGTYAMSAQFFASENMTAGRGFTCLVSSNSGIASGFSLVTDSAPASATLLQPSVDITTQPWPIDMGYGFRASIANKDSVAIDFIGFAYVIKL